MNKFFQLADKAKNIGEYQIANLIFVFLLDLWLQGTNNEENGSPELRDIQGWDGSLRASLETQDPLGGCVSEVYYDLLVLELGDDTVGEHSINIPIPLLTAGAAFTALKSAEIVDRREHNREVRDPSEEESYDLFRAFYDLIPNGDKVLSLEEEYLREGYSLTEVESV